MLSERQRHYQVGPEGSGGEAQWGRREQAAPTSDHHAEMCTVLWGPALPPQIKPLFSDPEAPLLLIFRSEPTEGSHVC